MASNALHPDAVQQVTLAVDSGCSTSCTPASWVSTVSAPARMRQTPSTSLHVQHFTSWHGHAAAAAGAGAAATT